MARMEVQTPGGPNFCYRIFLFFVLMQDSWSAHISTLTTRVLMVITDIDSQKFNESNSDALNE